MKRHLVLLALCSCAILTPPSGPGTSYPCGLHSVSCGNHMCCDNGTACGPTLSCRPEMCCLQDNDDGRLFGAKAQRAEQ